MAQTTFKSRNRHPSADIVRVLSTVILLMISVLAIFHAAPFWLIPAEAAAFALLGAKLLSDGALAASVVHVSAGVWALIVSIALIREVSVTQTRSVIQVSLYLFLTCALGVFFGAAKLVDHGKLGQIELPILYSMPGALAVAIGFFIAIVATGIPSLYDQGKTSKN